MMLSLYTNMLVLVTGGAGFIGSTIVEPARTTRRSCART